MNLAPMDVWMDGWKRWWTYLSSVLPVVNGRSVVTVTGRDRQLCLCARPSVYSLCVLTPPMCVFSPSGAAVAGVYRVAGKDMAPLEALVFGVGQTTLSVIISFSRILATL